MLPPDCRLSPEIPATCTSFVADQVLLSSLLAGQDTPEICPSDKTRGGHCLLPAAACGRGGNHQYDHEHYDLAAASQPKGGETSGFPRSGPLPTHVGNGAEDVPCLFASLFFRPCTQLHNSPESNP
jgi:hypothetical protein